MSCIYCSRGRARAGLPGRAGGFGAGSSRDPGCCPAGTTSVMGGANGSRGGHCVVLRLRLKHARWHLPGAAARTPAGMARGMPQRLSVALQSRRHAERARGARQYLPRSCCRSLGCALSGHARGHAAPQPDRGGAGRDLTSDLAGGGRHRWLRDRRDDLCRAGKPARWPAVPPLYFAVAGGRADPRSVTGAT
jgi:hypothetical protein